MSPPHGHDDRDREPTDEEIAAEIRHLWRRVERLGGAPRPAADASIAPAAPLAVCPMPLANRDRREYSLFYDLFVHWSRRKLTAVAPGYGGDFDFAAHGVDPDRVVLRVGGPGGLRVPGRRIPHGLDGIEPSVLFDFEHPELAARIAAAPELEVRVIAGDAARTFWIDTRPPPAHEISLALCVHDENRWLPFYLDYYLDVLGVDHVYVYDHRTRDARGLRTLLAPHVARGRATLVPWDVEWTNRVDGEQIGQPPQQAHALARFGADRWIGFFDVDEFLDVPDGDLRGLLAPYDPAEVGGVAFGMRWGVYKGERSLRDVHNPVVEFVYTRDDAHWSGRWKLFVSPRRVRFMRIHWIQDDAPTVHRPDVKYVHYAIREARFEEGRGPSGLGAETSRDETLRRAWEAREARRRAAPASPLVAHVEESFARALRRESDLPAEVLSIPGMIGECTRHLYNQLASLPGARLLEIGAWKGASTCAFLHGNDVAATVIDDWSQFGNHRELCLRNLERSRGASRITVLETDCFGVDRGALGPFDLFLYDAAHDEASQHRAVVDFYPTLADEAVLLVDDWNWRGVRDGTLRALDEIGADVLFAREITLAEVPRGDGTLGADPRGWWNGLGCFVLRRRPPGGSGVRI